MANFDSVAFLQQGLNRLTPQGGFGIPNIGALQSLLQRQSSGALRGAVGSDLASLNRAGLGRSVAGAFSPGNRTFQFNQSLMDQLQKLFADNAQLGQGQRAQILGLLSGGPLQTAFQQSQKPSFLSSLFGNLLGTGASLFGPGLAAKAFGPSQMEQLIMQMLGSGGYARQGSVGPGPNAIP